MKRILYILGFFLTLSLGVNAQDDQANEKIRERMQEYIQEKLGLSKAEAEKFAPVFIDYFRELRKTNHQYKGDPLLRQQKIVELRIKYRDQFKPVIGEKRSNDVFEHERAFIREAKEHLQDRIDNRKEGRKKNL